MKTKLLLVLWLLCGTLAFAQTSSGTFTTKPAQPKVGQEIRLTYNPTGTLLEKATAVTALVYAYNGSKAKVQEISLTKVKNGWEGRFKPAPEVDGAVVLFRQDEEMDNNNGKGYFLYFYNTKKQLVPGAVYGLAAAYANWGPMVGIDHDPKKALELIETELSVYPARRRDVAQIKLYALSSALKGDEASLKIRTELEFLSQQENLTVEDLTLLTNLYGRIKDEEKATAFKQKIKAIEPTGEFVQMERIMAYYQEKDADKQKELALAFAADFPTHERVGSMLSSIASEHASGGNWNEFDAFVQKYPQVATSSFYNSIAWKLYESGENPSKAKELAFKGYQLAQKEVNQPSSTKEDLLPVTDWKKSREYSLGQVADTYGAILLKEGDTSAEKYLAEAYTYTRGRSTGINERYAQVLASSSDKAKAQKTIEGIVASGNSTSKVKGYLQELYAKTNNSDAGFDAYWAKIEAPALEKMQADLKNRIISEQAPGFELVDLNGNTVSLASLKGKTVVVDFWATWCGPCVASFPSMQQAVNKYKDNDKVAFVFVNTWENGKDKKKAASDFMGKKNYTFQVLMDEEDRMVSAYKVSGIPTKFVLDGTGKIRFKSVGFSGNNEKTVQELTMLIEMLQNEQLTSMK